MSDNIVYSAYSIADGDTQPSFVNLHLQTLQNYCRKYGHHCEVIINNDYKPNLFVKYECFEHFLTTNYNSMLYIDWDVFISTQSSDIFSEYTDAGFAAFVAGDMFSLKDDFMHIPEFLKTFYNDVHMLDDIQQNYFSAGVMLASKDIVKCVIPDLREIYKKINKHYMSTGHIKKHILREMYATNYCIHKNQVGVTRLDAKWNSTPSMVGRDRSRDYFIHFDSAHEQTERDVLSFLLKNKTIFFKRPQESVDYIKNNFNQSQIMNLYGDQR